MMAQESVASIATRRVDYAFAIGDAVLSEVAFAALLGRSMEKKAAA